MQNIELHHTKSEEVTYIEVLFVGALRNFKSQSNCNSMRCAFMGYGYVRMSVELLAMLSYGTLIVGVCSMHDVCCALSVPGVKSWVHLVNSTSK